SGAPRCHDQPAVAQETARPVRDRPRSTSHCPPTLTTPTTPSTPNTPTPPATPADTAPPAQTPTPRHPSVHGEQQRATSSPHTKSGRPTQLPRIHPQSRHAGRRPPAAAGPGTIDSSPEL